MSQLLNSYPIFEGNQVLTSSQLNELVAYLDEQNRITRAKLIGQGIMCGMQLTLGADGSGNPTILISQGTGITSMGFLITIGDCLLTKYKEYDLPANGIYAPFVDPQTQVQDVSLFEMVTEDYVPLPGEVVKRMNDPAGFLNNKVVMLFLEAVDEDLKSCLGKSCDENGMERIFTLRKLLVSKTDIDTKIIPRTCSQINLFNDKYDLPEVIIRRVLFDPVNPHSSNYFKFSENYSHAIKGDKFVSPFVTNKTNLYQKLFDALKQTYIDFAAILAPVYGGVNPFLTYPISTWTAFLNGVSTGPKYLGMQYFYDFIKDLILAYNEFRDVAFDVMSECCPSLDCFPRHLFLGEAIPVPGSCKPSRYRHGFVTSPAFNSQNEKLAKAVMLHKRIVLMLRKFNLSIINNPSGTPVPPSELGQPLFITPSNEKRQPLSDRAIPYYYKIDEADFQLGTLERSWNYEFIKKCLFSKGLEPLAYGNQDILQTVDQGPIKTPLYYDTDPYNFFRIEGALRQNYVAATQALEDLKQRFDLPFNIITLRLSGPPLDNIAERCDFDDLRTEYGTLRIELLCLIKDMLDRFAVIRGGEVGVRPNPTFISNLINDFSYPTQLGSVTQPQVGVSTGDIATKSPTFDAAPAPVQVPVYAPQRTIDQLKEAVAGDLQNLIKRLFTLQQQMLPFNFTEFDYGYTGKIPNTKEGFIQNYLAALQFAINLKVDYNQLFDLLIHTWKTRFSPELYFDLGRYADEILGLIEKFITDCRYKSLTLLNYTFQYRLQQVTENDQTLFRNFIKKHPGIQHMAGVHRGNTYIMVVNGDPITVDKPQLDYVVSVNQDVQNMKVERAILQAKPVKTVQETQQISVLDGQLVHYQTLSATLAAGIPVQRFQLEPTQVLADFTLPYLCCCDCECEVKHPTNITELNIPTLAVPFYAEYSLGDYAFGENLFVNKHIDAQGEAAWAIDVLAACNYDKTKYKGNLLKLYLIQDGVRMEYKIEQTGRTFTDYGTITTYNQPNDPANKQPYGGASVRVYSNGLNPIIVYSPFFLKTSAVDSFYYMFEVLDNITGAVIERSTIGTCTIAAIIQPA